MIPELRTNVTETICEQLKNMFDLDFVKITGENWISREPDATVNEDHNDAFLFCKTIHRLIKRDFWCPDIMWSYKGHKFRGRIQLSLISSKYSSHDMLCASWGHTIELNREEMIENSIKMIKNSIKDFHNKNFREYSYNVTERTKNIIKPIKQMDLGNRVVYTNVGKARFRDDDTGGDTVSYYLD
jgi:hypothetical protein